jgi:glycosidase
VWIYFLMVDRFNRPGAPPRHQPFDDPNFYGYQGGTYRGVQEQLRYIRDLGAGAIWLSPVLKNLQFDVMSYHGYGIHDFLHAEPRFAQDPQHADDELRALVDAAHELGLFVIFDIVLNHIGDAFAYLCDPSDVLCQQTAGAQAAYHPAPAEVRWRDPAGRPVATDRDISLIANPSTEALVWPAELHSNDFFRRQGGPQPGGDETIGDFASLKQLRSDNGNLQSLLIQAYQYVIARWDVDGFRIDTLRYLKGGLPRLFGNAVREFALLVGKKNFFTFGEVFDPQAEQDIARFIGRNTSDGNDTVGVDAALDYPLYFVLPSLAKGLTPPSRLNDMYQLRKTIERGIVSSHGDATRFFVTFADNHDVKQRIRYVQSDGTHPFDDQVTLAVTCLFTLPGVPCLYYGTEQGLHGAGSDPAVREALWGGPGFAETSPFYKAISAIAAARRDLAALRYGRFYLRPISGDGLNYGLSTISPGVLAFSRILAAQDVLVVANTHPTTIQQLHVIVDQNLNSERATLSILYSNKDNPARAEPLQLRHNVIVTEPDGATGTGPVMTCRVTLQPMEAQVLTQPGRP